MRRTCWKTAHGKLALPFIVQCFVILQFHNYFNIIPTPSVIVAAASFLSSSNHFSPHNPLTASKEQQQHHESTTDTCQQFDGSSVKWQMIQRKPEISYSDESSKKITPISRRHLLFRSVLGYATFASLYSNNGNVAAASAYYKVNQVEPDENKIYALAQTIKGKTDRGSNTNPLSILWVGSGIFDNKSRGVYQNLFLPGTNVLALDLKKPTSMDLQTATTYATEQGYQLRFAQGDATKLQFDNESFDVVVCSMFLCQDFIPEVVVSEIRRVLRSGGQFGFYEHVEDIDNVIVKKVFGERSVIQVQHYPEKMNIMAGVVKKV